MATLTLQSSGNGTGYFTLLAGNNATCGTAAQTAAGLNAVGSAAIQHGSLALVANTPGIYTIRTLAAATPYTVCFSADQGGDAAPPLALNLTTTAMATDSTPAWENVGIPAFSAADSTYEMMVFASDGTPFVAFRDGGADGKASVMKYNGTAWVAVGAARFSDGSVSYVSLALAPDDTPFVAYQDAAHSQKTTVMKFDGTNWVAVGTPGFSSGSSMYHSLAFAPDGKPWLMYQDSVSSTSVTAVMKYDGTAWVAVGGTSGIVYANDVRTLVFAPDGTPWLAYTDSKNFMKATVRKFDGTNWVVVGASGFTPSTAYNLALGFAPDGTPYLGCRDLSISTGGKASVMKYNGSAWGQVGTAGFSSANIYNLSLAVAPDGAPFVAYTDFSNLSLKKATAMRYDGSAWVTVGSANFSSATMKFPSLAFSPDGTPYLAFALGIEATATVMWLNNVVSTPTATSGTATGISATGTTLNGTVNPAGGNTSVSFDYGTTSAYGTNVVATPATVSGSSSTAVTSTLSALTCNTLYHFRVSAVNNSGAINGSDATFTTGACPAPPAIGTQPVNATVNSGANSSFTVSASGAGLSYQWQVNSGSGFSNISNGGVYSGATTATLAITGATAAMNGRIYQVVVSGSANPAATSTSATLTVNTEPVITTQPISGRVKQLNSTSFTVAASGYGTLSYQWQVSTDSGANFSAISDGAVPSHSGASYSGATTNTLTLTNTAFGMDGYVYQVIVSGRVSPAATSNSATLSVLLATLPITSGSWATPWSAAGGNAGKSGATLTLTPNSGSQAGYIFYTEAFSATMGLNVTFDYFSGNGTGADGISFFLIDGSTSPVAPGMVGGTLGYSSSVAAGTGGLVGGWLGIGFDEYGGFSSASGGPNGSPPGSAPDSITIRGKAPGYNYITKATKGVTPGFTIDGGNRKVNITVDKNQNITVQIKNADVVGSSWLTVIDNASLGQTAPATFKLGFAASTGGSTNLHQVSNVSVTVPIDDSLVGSNLPASAGNGSTVGFNLQVCPVSTTILQKDSKASVTITPTGMTLTQATFGPLDLSSGCVDIPVTGTITAASGGSYSYSATVSSGDNGFGDVNLTNNTTTQSGTVLAAPTVTSVAANSITATGATLNCTVNANNVSTVVSFDYGTTTAYGTSVTAVSSPVTGASATAVSAVLTGLTCNSIYHFRTKGVSTGGTTNGSDASFTTTACVPGEPINVSATAGNAQTTITFTAPVANGAAISGYTVTSSPSGGTDSNAGSTSLSHIVTGLTNGVPYTFTVKATNIVGTGLPSAASASATPMGAQTIGAISFNPATLTVGTATMASATATSGLDVSFSTSTPGFCSVNDRAVTALAVGTCTITANQSGNAGWNAASPVTQNISVTKAAQTITFTSPTVTKTYGAADFGPGASASSALAVTYLSSDTAVATITVGGIIHIVGAGSATITASQAGDAAYNAATGTLTLTVEKVPLTVTADNKSRAYGAADPVFTASYNGLVKGEDVSVLSGAPALSTDAVNTSASGSYTITPALGTLSSANYSFTYVTGTLAIDLTLKNITFNPLPTKTYGAENFSVTATGGADGIAIVYASSNTAVATVVGSTVTVVGAGTTVITASQAESPGSAATSARQTLTVKKAPLMVTAESYERFYRESNPFFTVTYNGFVNGQDTTVISGAPAFTATATSSSPTGAYPITTALGTLAAPNYDFIFNPGTLAVNLALQHITFTTKATKTYGDASFDPGATDGGSGNPLIYTSSDPAVATVSGSTITITGAGQAIITASQAGNYYYAPAQARQILIVEQKTVTVTADSKTRVYGVVNPALTFSYSGFASGDDATKLSGAPVVSTTADSASVSGIYPITVAAGNLFSGNYSFTYTDGTLTVSKAPAAVTLDAVSLSRFYIGAAQAATATTVPSGLYVEFSYTDAGSNPVSGPIAVSSYNVVATINDLAYSGSASGTLTIAKAARVSPLTVSYSINGSSPLAASLTDATYSFTTTLDDGMNTIKVLAISADGQKVEAKRTVDFQQPTFFLAVNDPVADIRMTKNSYLITGTVADNSSPVNITIAMDGQNYYPVLQNGTFQQLLTFNTDKVYQISASGTDQNNNVQNVQRNIIHSTPKSAEGTAAPFTIIDALQALQMSAGIITPSTGQIMRMDVAPMVNGVSVGDGRVDIEDALVILYMSVGLIK